MKKRQWRTIDLTTTALMAALVFAGTYFFKIPIATGYIHLGDCMILLTVALFGTKKGALAGAIGACLADLAGGYAYWMLPTAIIKCMWALIAGTIMYRVAKGQFRGFAAGSVVGGAMQVAAYTLVNVLLYGVSPAVAEIPAEMFQAGAGIVLGIVIYRVLEKSGAAAKITGIVKQA